MWKRHGRRTPYSDRGIRRLPCFRCGAKAVHQWQICADGNLYRPICQRCDTALNQLVLEFMRHPALAELMVRYETLVGAT